MYIIDACMLWRGPTGANSNAAFISSDILHKGISLKPRHESKGAIKKKRKKGASDEKICTRVRWWDVMRCVSLNVADDGEIRLYVGAPSAPAPFMLELDSTQPQKHTINELHRDDWSKKPYGSAEAKSQPSSIPPDCGEMHLQFPKNKTWNIILRFWYLRISKMLVGIKIKNKSS